jgi:hypothetical protein
VRQPRYDHAEIPVHPFHRKLGSIPVEDRLLDEEHAAIARAALHQMIRPLKYEVPTKVGETNYVELLSH